MSALRIRLFIDFWNFQLQWNDYHRSVGAGAVVKIPWDVRLPQVLISEVSKGNPAKYAGTHVYASIDPGNPADAGLRRFLHAMDSFPGYKVLVKERKPGNPPKCSACKSPVATCPKCNAPMRKTVEKGIDAALLTDLIQYAFDDNFDQAILVSGDADFVPAVEYIQRKTDKQIAQCFFKKHGTELRNACWEHFYFDDLMTKLLNPASASTS